MKNIIIISFFLLLFSCAEGINKKQILAYKEYKEKGLLVEENNPRHAFGFSFLPGGGSFYNQDYDIAVFNLFLWPISSVWELCNSQDRAKLINLKQTEEVVLKNFKKDILTLEHDFITNKISHPQYIENYNTIFNKYNNSHSLLLENYSLPSFKKPVAQEQSQNTANFSDLSIIEPKILNICKKELNILQKEIKTIGEDNFLHKCQVEKRQAFIKLGL
jgi:hypothetical protein